MSASLETGGHISLADELPLRQTLAPFVVESDWLATHIPETAEIADVWNRVSEQRKRKDEAKAESSREIDVLAESLNSRGMRRKILNSTVSEHINKAQTAAIYMAMEAEPETREQFLWDLLRPRFSRNPYSEIIIDDWVGEILGRLPNHEKIRETSFRIDSEIGEALEDSPSGQYELLTMMMDADDSMQEASHTTTVEALTFMLNLAQMERGNGVVGGLTRTLEDGGFDDFVARDVLSYVANNEDNVSEEFRPITKMWMFSRMVSPTLSPEDLQARIMQNMDYWPSEIMQAVAKVRGKMSEKLAAKLGLVTGVAATNGLNAPKGNLKVQFDSAFRYFASVLPKQEQAMMFTRDQMVRTDMEIRHTNKRPRNGNGNGKLAEQEIPSSLPEEGRVIEPLGFLSRVDGTIHDEDDEEFTSLIDEYLQLYRGCVGLDEDVERILTHLRNVDFSKGPARGIKKYHSSIKPDETEYSLYSFKPAEAPGLSIRTSRGKKIRIFFAMLENSRRGIVAIADRDKVPSVEKSLYGSSNAK